MTIKKSLLTAVVALTSLAVSAQEPVEEFEYKFNPHWYGRVQAGVQETLGENSFSNLLSPNAQLAVGYRFNPLFGARLSLNSWQSKGSIDYNNSISKWKWNYIAPMVDATFNLTNAIGGYKHDRLVDLNLLAGLGANIGYDNKEANDINAALSKTAGFPVLQKNWTGTKARFVFRMGVGLDFNVAKNWAIGLELQANVLPDGYNSKKADNADWYFNGLVGVKYSFGSSFTKNKKERPAPKVIVKEKIVEKIVEVPAKTVAAAVVKEVQEPISRDIFFTISKTNISVYEMEKVKEVADYLKANPRAKVVVTGYADKGTGSLKLNMSLAERRAKVVADTLRDKFGIAADRIQASGMTVDAVPPFNDPVLNRVAVCVTEK